MPGIEYTKADSTKGSSELTYFRYLFSTTAVDCITGGIFMKEEISSYTTQQRLAILEKSVEGLGGDAKSQKDDVKQFQQELRSWFDRLDLMVQELRLSHTKLQEQMTAHIALEKLIQEELKDAKKFRGRLFLAATGGAVSLIVFLVQDILSR